MNRRQDWIIYVAVAVICVSFASSSGASGPAGSGGQNPRRMFTTVMATQGPGPNQSYGEFPVQALVEVPQGHVLVLERLWLTPIYDWTKGESMATCVTLNANQDNLILYADGKAIAGTKASTDALPPLAAGTKVSVGTLVQATAKCSFNVLLTGHMMRN